MTDTTLIQDSATGDMWMRASLDVIRLYHDEAETIIGTVFMHWQQSSGVREFTPWTAGNTDMPDEMIFDPDLLIGIETVICEEDNPSDYVIIEYPGNRKLGDIANRVVRRCYVMDFLSVKMSRQIAYDEIRRTIDGVSEHYRRLLLPVGNTDGVTRIHAVSRDLTVTAPKLEKVLQ